MQVVTVNGSTSNFKLMRAIHAHRGSKLISFFTIKNRLGQYKKELIVIGDVVSFSAFGIDVISERTIY